MAREFAILAASAMLAVVPAWSQTKPAGGPPNRMTLAVERYESGTWRAVDPSLIFSQNDRVRFRFSANFDGYLYVMNRSTSGKYEMLFPREDTGEQNRVESGKQYIVPATQGWFRITGPAGHDVLYWVVSPLNLGAGAPRYRPLPPPPPPGAAPANLKPRCDDAIFKARGDCVDSSAGPKQVTAGDQLPENLRGLPGVGSRELLFMQEQNRLVVSSPAPLEGPAVYEFQLSHR
jgi:hypothetical protein